MELGTREKMVIHTWRQWDKLTNWNQQIWELCPSFLHIPRFFYTSRIQDLQLPPKFSILLWKRASIYKLYAGSDDGLSSTLQFLCHSQVPSREDSLFILRSPDLMCSAPSCPRNRQWELTNLKKALSYEWTIILTSNQNFNLFKIGLMLI